VLESHYHQVGRTIDSLLAMTADESPQHSVEEPPSMRRGTAAYVGVPQREPYGRAALGAVAGPSSAGPGASTEVLERVVGERSPSPDELHTPSGGTSALSTHVGGPVSLLAPRSGGAALAAAQAADLRRASSGSLAGPPPAPRLESAGANLMAWMAQLLTPGDGEADERTGGGGHLQASSPATQPRGSDGAARAHPPLGGAPPPPDGDGELWAWPRGAGAGGCEGEEERALAAGERLWEAAAAADGPAQLLSLLCSAPRCAGCAALLGELAGQWNRGFQLFPGSPLAAVAVPARLECWRTELAALAGVVVAELLEAGGAYRSCRWHAPHADALQLAVENCLLHAVHPKLSAGMQGLCERADEAMGEALERLQRLPPHLLGVRSEWAQAALEPELLRRFRQLPLLTTPHQQCCCVRDTLKALVDNVQALRPPPGAQGEAQPPPMPMPCADDVLSLMVLLLARARVRNLVAACVYMDTFLCMTEATSHKGELGYALANFLAACEYARSRDVARLCSEWEENGRAWDYGAELGEGGEEDPLGALAGVAELAQERQPRGAPSSPVLRARTAAPSVHEPWLLSQQPPQRSAQPHAHGVVQETARGAAEEDPLGATRAGPRPATGDEEALAELSLDGTPP